MLVTIRSARRWFWWHKWTSLICTLFLLMLCLTGLPLIFYEEIEAWTQNKGGAAPIPEGSPLVSLDTLLSEAAAVYPGQVARYAYWDLKAHPHEINFSFAPRIDAPPDADQYVTLDNRNGKVIPRPDPTEGFMYTMLELHVEMFAGLPGKLFLGFMGILFIVAIFSGVMLYGPIMKKYDFGMVRKGRSRRLRWLDMHNLLGIVTLTWVTVVGITGVINTLSDVVLGLWQRGQLAEMTAPYRGQPPAPLPYSSLEKAVRVAEAAAPDMQSALVAFPGTPFTSRHHYAVFMQGNTPLTSRLAMPALVDAQTGQLTDMRPMPWYVNTLFLSQPLHFGDYGGLPLKILWALLDLATIVVLLSGLYLWFSRIRAARGQLRRLGAGAGPAPALPEEAQQTLASSLTPAHHDPA